MNNLEISLVSHDRENPFGIEDGLRHDTPYEFNRCMLSPKNGMDYNSHHYVGFDEWDTP